MKRMTITIFLSLLFLPLFAPGDNVVYLSGQKLQNPYEALFKAICAIESSGDTLAWNKKEDSRGVLQIRKIRLLDYNIKAGKNYKHSDCFRMDVSREIFFYYASGTYEEAAKAWNASRTDAYWNRVKKQLK